MQRLDSFWLEKWNGWIYFDSLLSMFEHQINTRWVILYLYLIQEKDEAEAGKVEEVLLVSDGSVSSSGLNITEKEAKLIGMLYLWNF